jgi:hypothetical protein
LSQDRRSRRASTVGGAVVAVVVVVVASALAACGDAFSTGDGATATPTTSTTPVTTTGQGGSGGATTTTAHGGSGGTTTTIAHGGSGGATSTSALGGAGGTTSTSAHGGVGGATGAGGHGGAGGVVGCGAQQEACVPTPIPNGFTGPVLLYVANAPGDVPGGPGGWTLLDATPRGIGQPKDKGTCDFSCDVTSAPGCTPPLFDVYNSCQQPRIGQSQLPPGCHVASGDAASMEAPPVFGTPTCAPVGKPQLPPLFANVGWRCELAAPASHVCAGGECVPSPSQGGRVCVSAPDGTLCPDAPQSPYSEKHRVVLSATDQRTCAAPSCGATAACQATLRLFSDGNCGTLAKAVPAGTCVDAQFGSYSGEYDNGGNAHVTCAPSGGDVGGSVTVSDAVTLCCIPK